MREKHVLKIVFDGNEKNAFEHFKQWIIYRGAEDFANYIDIIRFEDGEEAIGRSYSGKAHLLLEDEIEITISRN